MFKAAFTLMALAIFSSVIVAQDTSIYRIGYTGTLSSLDGGLGGVVRVINSTALEITNYMLKDASAPALYWWGTTDGMLRNGFRISNKQVTDAATTNILEITLDAGKSTANFSTVGLWCERFSANFGQATLVAPATGSNSAGSSSTPTGSAAASTTTAKSAGMALVGSQTGIAFAMLVAIGFAVWMR